MNKRFTYYIHMPDALSSKETEFLNGLTDVLDSQNSPWAHIVDVFTAGIVPDAVFSIGECQNPPCLYLNKYQYFRLNFEEPLFPPWNSMKLNQQSLYNSVATLYFRDGTLYEQDVASRENVPISKGFFSSVASCYPHNDAYSFGQSVARGLADFVMAEEARQEKKEEQT